MWWLLLFLPVCGVAPNPDTFTVSGPDGPLSVWMGSSIILPCSVSPAFTESLKVRWHRPEKYKTPVLLYEKQQIQHQSVDPQFRGRVSLIGELEKGNVSLKLDNVSVADRGEFVCFVAGDKWYEQASVHLIVKAMGSPPVLSVTDGGSGQVNVTCVSDGWSPQPTLTWRNNRGTEIPSQSHHNATDARGLVSVTSWLLHSSSDSEWFACSAGLSEEERKECRILPHICRTDTVELERILRDRETEMETLKQKSKDLEERLKQENTGPWKEVLIIVLVLLLLSSIAAALILYKKGFIIRKDSKEAAAEYQQLELLASGGETENLLKKKEDVETLKQEEEAREKRMGTLKKEEETLKQKITELQRELNNRKGEVETLNQPIKATDEDKGITLEGKGTKRQNDIKKENQKLKKQNEELQDQLDDSKRKVERLNQQIKAHEDERKKEKEKVNGIEKENQELKQKNEDLLKKQSEEVETPNGEEEEETHKQKIAELQSELDTSKINVEKLNQQIKADEDERKKLEEQLNDIKKENQKLNQKNEADEHERNRLERKLNDIKKENQEPKQQNKGAFPQNQELVIPLTAVTRFKKNLTMDEASVQGDLEVDRLGKSVKCTKPNIHETLNTMKYVLCKQTFSSGQHFWKVSVKDKESWFVGVCSDALRGQHGVSLASQNSYWLLCYDIDQGLFVNTDSKITSVQEKNTNQLVRLGVFLDCCRHSLTFYDSVSQSLLCTICDVGQTLPLVPVFSPGGRDKCDLKIKDLNDQIVH